MKLLKITIAFSILVSLQIATAQWLHVPPPVEAKMSLTMAGGGVVAAGGGCTPAYVNTGGTGDRTAIITCDSTLTPLSGGALTELIDGVTNSSASYFPNADVTGKNIRYDFGAAHTAVVINELKFYQENTSAQGTWQFAGSANGTDFTNIGDTFALGGVTTQTITTMSGNTTGYRYYRIIGISGSSTASPYVYEFEFKICGY